MEMENLYNKVNAVGIRNLVFGIVTICLAVATGIVLICDGAKLLKSKKDIIF